MLQDIFLNILYGVLETVAHHLAHATPSLKGLTATHEISSVLGLSDNPMLL
jgi:hypothetical protein